MFEGTSAKFEEPYVKKDMIVGWPGIARKKSWEKKSKRKMFRVR